MLYISTRNNTDSFTAFRTLCEDRTPDGGLFVPFRMPVFSQEQILDLPNHSFGENVAFVLNHFFSVELTGWDVDFCLGRKPFKQVPMNHRLTVSELWHNHRQDYGFSVESLYRKLCGEHDPGRRPTQWAEIAIHIAILFGIWADLSSETPWQGDMAVTPEYFISVWYAREMGLPIQHIICAAEDESLMWDLLHRGECATAAISAHGIDEKDSQIFSCAERLIFGTLGLKENKRFLECCAKRSVFQIGEDFLDIFGKGVYVSVVSRKRVESVSCSFFRSCGYICGFDTAVCYGGLQDYRAQTGKNQTTLLTAGYSPVFCVEKLERILNISVDEIKKRINNL